ncbi:MAG TPA: DUF5700 domain-containing putative Zn-dependent protease [Terriglobales bacterium]|nr:DUF5700 domain-containing putative Zn-dependent protease [Terriglobales bacterium]
MRALVVLLACLATGSLASAQKIKIHFDYSNADATLEALTSAPTDAAAVERLTTLKDTAAVVAKRAQRDPQVTLAVYKQTLLEARAHQALKADPFQWQFCIDQIPQMRMLLASLHQREPEILERVSHALARHLDPQARLEVTVHFIIGGVSAGWESGDADFFVGLPFYKGDVEGVILTMQHELFHNAQYMGFHDQAAELSRLDPSQQEVYRLLDELFREGTANYVENLGRFPPDAPFIREMRAPAITNWERMKDNFVLLDTLVYRLSHDRSVRFADLESLGFDWDWQNPLYFAGQSMARDLVGKDGTLAGYLHQSPVVFARDYVKACTPPGHCSYPLAPETVATILAIDERLRQAPADPASKPKAKP